MRSKQERERHKNCHIFKLIFDVIRYLAKHKVAFRGHDKELLSQNKGNFLEKLQFISKYHPPLKAWIEKHFQDFLYFSHVSLNENNIFLQPVPNFRLVIVFCFGYRLNFVFEHTVKNIPTVKSVFEIIDDIYRFTEGFLLRQNAYKNI